MAQVVLNPTDMKFRFRKATRNLMERLGAELAVLQMEQVNAAFKRSGQPTVSWPPIKAATNPLSYRFGGSPLQDTGLLAASWFNKDLEVTDTSVKSRVTSSQFYAVYHQHGFRTKGPNFIPLTLKARRGHQPGANPKTEGLAEGRDYVTAWKGVTVPARPMIDYADPVNKQEIRDTIVFALKL